LSDREDHFLDLGYAVTKRKDCQIKGTTSLAPYDLIVLTEFAPGVSTAGIDNIKNSGKPVLVTLAPRISGFTVGVSWKVEYGSA
jgi:protein-L-isoaspartate O-methyltransferase